MSASRLFLLTQYYTEVMGQYHEAKQSAIVPGVSPFGRIFLWLAGFFIAAAFISMWMNNPKFVQGPIDFPEIFMGIVTLLMLALSILTPMIAQSWTRVTTVGLESKFIRRQNLTFEEIEAVVSAVQMKALVFNICVVVRIRTKSGNIREFFVGTPEQVRTLFQILVLHVPGLPLPVIAAVHFH